MDETTESGRSWFRDANEDGRLYFWGGIVAAAISLFVLPIVGLLAVYWGYQLHAEEGRTVPAVVIAGAGATGVLYWLAYLAAV
ncbi:hypothetical protein HLRTI_002061 [Halorhabdus tiamatea SARL4B]|uniref:Uncharacterized protein n=1 Tax=Halorhabdus tiamatea SARL4B TaxID=1033806 RepID=F7PIY9_9EURY|nr:hypothetical protein [Halorhabdus tiamatea]ERJ05909.1 hypothetical protein HLRTI_002061 [Halorhabdus tiamatea SARL4B]CCQ32955.1 hypothetical protein HTIA_0815 [Halorhabdus tiamatea SARL4B]